MFSGTFSLITRILSQIKTEWQSGMMASNMRPEVFFIKFLYPWETVDERWTTLQYFPDNVPVIPAMKKRVILASADFMNIVCGLLFITGKNALLMAMTTLENSILLLKTCSIQMPYCVLYVSCTILTLNKYTIKKVLQNQTSSSSSCRAGSTDIPDPLSPLLPIVHRLRQVF